MLPFALAAVLLLQGPAPAPPAVAASQAPAASQAAAVPVQRPPTFPTTSVTEMRTGWRFAIGDNPLWARLGYSDAGWRPMDVPGAWQERGFPEYVGFAWYRLHYVLDSDVTEPMSVRFTSVAGAYEVLLDGRSVGGVGEFPPRYRARSGVPVNLFLPSEGMTRGEHVLAVRVYSEEAVGGITDPVLAGPHVELDAREFSIAFLLMSAALLLIGVSMFQLFFWARRPEALEHLFLFLFGASLGVVFLVWVPPLRAALSPSVDHYRVYLLFASLSAAFFLFAFRRLFDLERNRLLFGLGVLFSVLAAVGPLLPGMSDLRAAGTHVLDPAVLLAAASVAVLSVIQYRSGVQHARALLVGMTVLGVTLVHDVFAEWGLTATRVGVPWMTFGASVFVLSVGYITARQFVDTAGIALYDRLTGLYRREVVMDALHREIRRAARTHQSLAVIMMDLDNFKTINDTLGHQAGDRVLAEVGRRLATAGRAVDWLGRYGGEEFFAILADSDVDGAQLAAERFRQAVGALPIDTGRASRALTLSAGIAAYDGGSEWPTPEQLVGGADAALYRAKRAGKNQVHA